MAKKKTKIINGPLQKEIIIRGLPFGAFCEKYMRGEKESGTKSIRKSFHKLLKRGVFQKIPLNSKGVLKRVKRYDNIISHKARLLSAESHGQSKAPERYEKCQTNRHPYPRRSEPLPKGRQNEDPEGRYLSKETNHRLSFGHLLSKLMWVYIKRLRVQKWTRSLCFCGFFILFVLFFGGL